MTLVFAGPKESANVLRGIVAEAGWQVQRKSNWRRALHLARNIHATVFIYDCDANPRDWGEALTEVLNTGGAPAFLMTSRLADEAMWAELLVRQGFDLILTPFDRAEVLRVIRSAHTQHERAAGEAQPICSPPA